MRQFLACLIALTACKGDSSSSSSSPPSPAPTPTSDAAAAPSPSHTSAPPPPVTDDSGFCTLDATGAFEGSGTGGGDAGSVASTYWTKNAPLPVKLLVNCHATPDLRITLGSTPTGDVPFGPKTYTIVPVGGDFGISGKAGSAILHMAGTLAITAWDGKHVAGTVDLTGKRIKDGGQVKITGKFDFPCRGACN